MKSFEEKIEQLAELIPNQKLLSKLFLKHAGQ
ncbi:hypothetical protein ES703_68263 [subsurface metagenome]